ncbi:MAG: right-handed parallel beta-helix repeat-containing protein [Ardenticatenaceae bacterium]|nr:right-handed parallel beta-helix repeat-containing protein [Ardenticatenaceae bacterium]
MSQFHEWSVKESGWRFLRFALFSILILCAVFLHSRSLFGLNQSRNASQSNGWQTAVTFPNNKTASILHLAETQIDTAVPEGTTSGNVSVTTDTGTSNSVSFELGSNFIPDEAGEAESWQSTFSGTITTDTVWSTDLLLTGDVTVPAGVTLTINGGTTIFAAANSDDQGSGKWADKTELIVFGTLLVNGNDNAPVYFTSNAATKSAGSWGGIQIREGSTTSQLTHCLVRYASEGIRITSQNVPEGGDAWARVQNCSIQHNEIGITVIAHPNWPSGINIYVGAEIKNNLIANNIEEGIHLRNRSGYQSAMTDPLIVGNTIENNNMGIYMWIDSWWLGHVDDRTLIRNNTINNNTTYGIYIENMGGDISGSDTDAKPSIENNLLYENQTNIYLQLSPMGAADYGFQDFQPTVRYNTIREAPFGIVMSELKPYDIFAPTIDHNIFEGFDGPSNYAIANQTSRTVNVDNNYWGSTLEEWDAGMPMEVISGTVYSASQLDSTSPPIITRMTPGAGQVGESHTIYGANFGNIPQIFLPVMLNQAIFSMEPIFIGDKIPVRDVQAFHETFFSTAIQIPADLPPTGDFYFSAQPYAVSPVLVDDEIIVRVNGSIIYTHDFSADGLPQFATLIIPRPLMEQISGQTAVIEYRDVYGNVVTASEMWLIWVP